MSTLGHRKWDVFPPGRNLNCCTAQGKNICIVPPSSWSRSALRGGTDVFQGFGSKVLTLQICLYWATVFIPTLTALKHVMLVSSMWLIGPLVSQGKQALVWVFIFVHCMVTTFFSLRLLAKFGFPARSSNKTCLKCLDAQGITVKVPKI